MVLVVVWWYTATPTPCLGAHERRCGELTAFCDFFLHRHDRAGVYIVPDGTAANPKEHNHTDKAKRDTSASEPSCIAGTVSRGLKDARPLLPCDSEDVITPGTPGQSHQSHMIYYYNSY